MAADVDSPVWGTMDAYAEFLRKYCHWLWMGETWIVMQVGWEVRWGACLARRCLRGRHDDHSLYLWPYSREIISQTQVANGVNDRQRF